MIIDFGAFNKPAIEIADDDIYELEVVEHMPRPDPGHPRSRAMLEVKINYKPKPML